jgi:hypothetical protein
VTGADTDPGEWFEGCYVIATEAARVAFQRDFEAGAADGFTAAAAYR